jgi:diadenosine tetraphosphate (Ap4A) HIT family hydrolase
VAQQQPAGRTLKVQLLHHYPQSPFHCIPISEVHFNFATNINIKEQRAAMKAVNDRARTNQQDVNTFKATEFNIVSLDYGSNL